MIRGGQSRTVSSLHRDASILRWCVLGIGVVVLVAIAVGVMT